MIPDYGLQKAGLLDPTIRLVGRELRISLWDVAELSALKGDLQGTTGVAPILIYQTGI